MARSTTTDFCAARHYSRREMLHRATNGFGSLALTALLARESRASVHVAPRARSVIYLYMEGGPSQIDTFDPKPRLDRDHGKPIPFDVPNTVFNIGKKIFRSPFRFDRYGESGAWVSEIFPHVAECVDELAIIRSMHHGISNHSSACLISHTGYAMAGKPSIGSWLSYGLGSANDDLPAFVVLDCGQGPSAGSPTWGNGFLPTSTRGTLFTRHDAPIEYIEPLEAAPGAQRGKIDAIRALQRASAASSSDSRVDALIESYERAFRMQSAVPSLVDLSGESAATKRLYGIDRKSTELFGSRCLLARRLVESGVRFVEVLAPRVKADRWDQHGKLEDGHRRNALATDRAVAGLLRDLASRGLLDETIVLWGGEFGRTPNAQGADGRDHNPFGYTVWAAGGGFKPGIRYGETDEYGYFATRDKVHIHDLHATILYLLGIDHERLTFRHSGRDFRLTDVHGEVVRGVLD